MFEDFPATAGHAGADFDYVGAGMTVTARVDAAATFAAYTLKMLVFGLLSGPMPTAAVPVSKSGRARSVSASRAAYGSCVRDTRAGCHSRIHQTLRFRYSDPDHAARGLTC